MCRARRRAGGVRVLLLFSVMCILTAWCNARNVHVMRHLADSRYSNLWDGVVSNAWLNVLEGVWKNWKSWDTSRVGAAYIRHGVAAEREKNQQRWERENIGERQRASEGRRNVCCLRACVVNCDCAIPILDLVVWSSRYTVRLCDTPGTFIAVIRATALPWTTFSDHQNLRNLRTFRLHWPVRPRAVPEIIPGGWAAGTFLSCGGEGCFVDMSGGWGVTCPGGQGVFDPQWGGLIKVLRCPGGRGGL